MKSLNYIIINLILYTKQASFARKNFLKIGDNRLVEYKYYNWRTLCVVINIFNKVEGWIKIADCGFEIILIIIFRLYGKMPILRNPEIILIGEKAFF